MLTKALFLVLLVCSTLQTVTMNEIDTPARIGCYKEKHEKPFDLKYYYPNKTGMTVPECLNYCRYKDFKYAGLNGGIWCGCADSYKLSEQVSDSECNLECPGNKKTTCGGWERNEIYEPYFYSNIAEIINVGCYPENNLLNKLTYDLEDKARMTVPKCLDHCRRKGIKYAGLSEGALCGCVKNILLKYRKRSRREAKIQECKYPCPGNKLTVCGGSGMVDLFETFNYLHLPARTGCYKENANPPFNLIDYIKYEGMTLLYCLNYCRKKNFKYSGLNGGIWCGCTNSTRKDSAVSILDCNLPCGGNNIMTCGGEQSNEIYNTFSESFLRIGCYERKDDELQNELLTSEKMTVAHCVNHCKSKGFKYTSLTSLSNDPRSVDCTCGNSFKRRGKVNDKACGIKCPGNRKKTCGGYMKAEIFGQYIVTINDLDGGIDGE